MGTRDEDKWRNKANCLDQDTETFFPTRDRRTYKQVAIEAKKFCHGNDDRPMCPVLRDCLWDAIKTDQEHGILGGMSHRERNALIRKWQKNFRHEMTLEEYILESKGAETWQQSPVSQTTN